MLGQEFNALMMHEAGDISVKSLSLTDLPNEDTLVKIDYSTLNFKDALAVTGKGKIAKSLPLIPGIDFSGTVVETTSANFAAGDKVVLTGWGVGEKYWGGFSQYQRVQADWLAPLPSDMTTRQAMMIGTAGFTAMLCVDALATSGVLPETGPVLVTGASGGVGSVAVAILKKLGYQVWALTSSAENQAYLREIGADQFADGPQWGELPRPIESQRWAGAIDTVGSKVLARVLAETQYGGAVAACGLAGGHDLPTTVMPFILRGIKLIGIDSVMYPAARRAAVWQRLMAHLRMSVLEQISTETIGLGNVQRVASDMLERKRHGRVLIDVNA